MTFSDAVFLGALRVNRNRLFDRPIPYYITPGFIGSIVYNQAIVYKRQNFLKVAVHDCNQNAP